jgi:hypothetical protein
MQNALDRPQVVPCFAGSRQADETVRFTDKIVLLPLKSLDI